MPGPRARNCKLQAVNGSPEFSAVLYHPTGEPRSGSGRTFNTSRAVSCPNSCAWAEILPEAKYVNGTAGKGTEKKTNPSVVASGAARKRGILSL